MLTDDDQPPATRADLTTGQRDAGIPGAGHPGTEHPGAGHPGIPAADLALCLRVLAEADALPVEHPDALAIRRATARIYKGVKESRRSQRREKVLANDRAVTALTATGARHRIDDETQGLKLVSNATGALAGRC